MIFGIIVHYDDTSILRCLVIKVALRNNLFTSVAQHTDYSLQTPLFGDPKQNHKLNCDIFDAMQCFITLLKRFDWSPYVVSYITMPPPPPPPTSPPFPRPHSKQAEPMTSEICITAYTCIVYQLSLEINTVAGKLPSGNCFEFSPFT